MNQKHGKRHDLLLLLANAVNISDKKKGKLHEVWGKIVFEWKECNGDKFIVQKLDYMHNNPFTGRWQPSVNAIEYQHSSAKFYICGEQGIYLVMNYGQLDDIDLNTTAE